MATTVHTQEFTITGYSEGITRGRANVIVYDHASRWARALKGLAVAWLVAVGTAFIPVAHFLLVPGFALFGLFVFAKRLKTTQRATEISGTCPDCSLEQSFDHAGAWRLPRTLTCHGCRRALRARSADAN